MALNTKIYMTCDSEMIAFIRSHHLKSARTLTGQETTLLSNTYPSIYSSRVEEIERIVKKKKRTKNDKR